MPSSGSYTVGQAGSGADYATWVAALAAITSPLTGNLTFTQIDDTSEGASVAVAPSLDLAGFTLTLTSDTHHNGDPAAGHLISNSGTAGTITVGNGTNFLTSVAGGMLIIEKLNIRKTGTATCGSGIQVYPTSSGSVAQDITIIIRDIIVDTRASTSAAAAYGVYLSLVGAIDRFCNGLIMNVHVVGMRVNSAASYGGIVAHAPNYAYVDVENCVVTEVGGNANGTCYLLINATGSYNVTFRNCVAIQTSSSVGFRNHTTVGAGYGCMSTDATATTFPHGEGNVDSIVVTDEFVSGTFGDADWMKPKSDRAKNSGFETIYPAINDHGSIVSVVRPHLEDDVHRTSIGPREWPSTAAVSVQPTSQKEPVGDTATFSLTASGATGYQWQKMPYSGAWGDIALATSFSYTTPAVVLGDHLAQYRCRISSAGTDIYSSAAYLFVAGAAIPWAPPELSRGFAS